MSVRLRLLGSPLLEYRGETVALAFERRHQLLAFLALKRSWVGRTELAAMLWPDLTSKLAHTNLRKVLFRLQTLPWASGVESQHSAVRFQAQTDVFDFDNAVSEKRLAQALGQYRGEFLAAFDDGQSDAWSSWLSFERERLRAAWRSAALDHLSGEIDPVEGVDLSRRLLAADPLDEAAVRGLMLWLARSGQTAAARHAYRDFNARLVQELGLPPGSELQALHDSLGVPADRQRARLTTASVATDDGFVGRSVEMRQIASLLERDDCRLLCLIGPGGVGKTRLAQQAMQVLAPRHRDGAVFVPLEDVAAAAELGSRLAREMGLHLTSQGEPLDQVVEFLRTRQMLLILDNFEQLSGEAAILGRLLQPGASLKIVVTSRVRLGLPGEWLMPVEGLPCPEREDEDRIDAFDAVRLFARAARRIGSSLNVTAEAGSIADICRLVDGLPLALELAAGWTRVLSAAAIAAELEKGTELLRAVDASQPRRHASLEIVFEQSWRLLTPIERGVLSRLSVFRGGFSLEAARAVAGASLPVLSALADKSLLRRDANRMFLHPLVQQLAAVRLAQSDSRAPTEAAHARYFHRMLAQLRGTVEIGDREALRQLEAEFENCRLAWRLAIALPTTEALGRSTITLLRFCDHLGRFQEGLGLLREAIESAPSLGTGLRAQLLAAAAHLEYRLDRYAAAESAATQALAAARAAGDHDTQVLCLGVLGSCCLSWARHDDAMRFFKQALRQSRASADPRNVANMLDNQALVEKALGRYSEALRLSTESLAHYRRLGDAAGEALCLNNLGALQLDTHEYRSAAEHLKEGIELCERYGLAGTRGLVLTNLTELAIKTEDFVAAETHARSALEFAEAGGHRHLTSWVRLQLVLIALRRGDLPAARSNLAASMKVAVAIDRPSLQLAGVSCLADILAAQGELECAALVLRIAAAQPSTSAPEREAIDARLERWNALTGGKLRTPELGLGELVHRIEAEANIAYSSLLGRLKGKG